MNQSEKQSSSSNGSLGHESTEENAILELKRMIEVCIIPLLNIVRLSYPHDPVISLLLELRDGTFCFHSDNFTYPIGSQPSRLYVNVPFPVSYLTWEVMQKHLELFSEHDLSPHIVQDSCSCKILRISKAWIDWFPKAPLSANARKEALELLK